MSCPGTEARLNRRQQATVEKEHDTKSSGMSLSHKSGLALSMGQVYV